MFAGEWNLCFSKQFDQSINIHPMSNPNRFWINFSSICQLRDFKAGSHALIPTHAHPHTLTHPPLCAHSTFSYQYFIFFFVQLFDHLFCFVRDPPDWSKANTSPAKIWSLQNDFFPSHLIHVSSVPKTVIDSIWSREKNRRLTENCSWNCGTQRH